MDVAASEFYTEKDQKYDLNFKEEVRFLVSLFNWKNKIPTSCHFGVLICFFFLMMILISEQQRLTKNLRKWIEGSVQVICIWVPNCVDWGSIWPGWLDPLCQDDWGDWCSGSDCRWRSPCHQPYSKFFTHYEYTWEIFHYARTSNTVI